ncbi:MAG: hypothetical protein ACOJUL_11660 [Candidatus Pollutiaquabacter aromativorans]
MKRTSIRLLLLRIPLRLLLWSLFILPHFAEGRMPVDSLLTEKQAYTSREPIGFTVRLSSEAKPGTVRVIPTMSCSCSDRDFYYVVYRLGKGRGSAKPDRISESLGSPDRPALPVQGPVRELQGRWVLVHSRDRKARAIPDRGKE